MFKNTFKKSINNFISTSKILHGRSLYKHESSYLNTVGWFLSAKKKMAVNRYNVEIPWITYSSLYFIEPRLKKSFSLFEYGSGNSTIYWCSKLKDVVSCEHNYFWYEVMKKKIPDNAKYLYHELGNNKYSKSILNTEKDYHIIVIDGRERNKCAEYAVQRLKNDGVIIWDNSERIRYTDAFDMLKNKGFKKIDFFGMGPIGIEGWCTSIFYRAENCLGI